MKDFYIARKRRDAQRQWVAIFEAAVADPCPR